MICVDYTIKDLPESERPREKLWDAGVESLSDAELLAILLRTGVAGKNVKELSFEVLEKFSFERLAEASGTELKQVEGISDVKAGQLKAIGELGRRMQRESRETIESLNDVRVQVEDMKHRSTEALRAFYLNSGNEVVREREFDGSVSSVDVSPGEILREALMADASAFIVVHNHPSGEASFTEEDESFTRELLEASESLGVELLDHVVVGEEVVSLREVSGLW